MNVIAIIAARNETLYMGRCLEHLESHGVRFVLIDNGSTDDTRAIAETFRGRGLVACVDHPYPGHYDWTGLLGLKERLARQLDADWFLHIDADEIPEPPERDRQLVAALADVDRSGYTAVNFDEFCFVPTADDERHEGTDYVAGMRHYFYFAPRPERLIRCWKKSAMLNLADSGGHDATFPGRRLYPVNFVLRHYMALSMDHLRQKYTQQRRYAEAEIARGWHSWRPRLAQLAVRTPSPAALCDIDRDGGWDRSRPFTRHVFLPPADRQPV
jgi:glycosyltransferase involved in cell wall biosynthesis